MSDVATNKIDPICGMKGTIEKHSHWFCSQACIRQYEKQEGIENNTEDASDQSASNVTEKTKNNKWIAYVLIAVILIGGFLAWRFSFMLEFMGVFFVLVAILKLLDLPGFVEAYANYDLIAMNWRGWGWMYPFIELAIGLAFLVSFEVITVATITAILMIIGTIGVAIKLSKNEQFRCACLGTKLDIPLTNLTLVEDILMGVMSLIIIFG